MNGLVLSGGKSSRMGEDKGAIHYYDTPQREYMANLIQPFCKETFLSIRIEQEGLFASKYPLLVDKYTDLGPFGALLTAFDFDKNTAWLVVACDMPLVDEDVINYLLNHRQPSKIATAFKNEVYNFPEPLLTIWEPASFLKLQEALQSGITSLKKVLERNNTEVLIPTFYEKLKNINRPNERQAILEILKTKNRFTK